MLFEIYTFSFMQMHESSLYRIQCFERKWHWLKFLLLRQIAAIIQGPAYFIRTMACQITCPTIIAQPYIQATKTTKLRVTGLCQAGEFPAQRPVTQKMFPFDDVIMRISDSRRYSLQQINPSFDAWQHQKGVCITNKMHSISNEFWFRVWFCC